MIKIIILSMIFRLNMFSSGNNVTRASKPRINSKPQLIMVAQFRSGSVDKSVVVRKHMIDLRIKMLQLQPVLKLIKFDQKETN